MALTSSVCRVCLAGNIRMLLIDNLDLLQLFEKLTNLKMNTESEAGMPSTVCYVCHRHLQRCLLFSNMARRSDRIMHDMLHNGIEITWSTIIIRSLATTALSVAPTQHLSITHYSTASSTPATVKEQHVAVKVEENEEIEETVFAESEMTPDEDNDVVDSSKIYEENLNFVDNKQTKTHSCFYCNICNRKFLCKSKLEKHLQTHYRKKTHICEHCDKKFSYKSQLLKHIIIHTGKKPYSCTICNNKAYSQKFQLKMHMKVHAGEKPYSCSTCRKPFTWQGALKNHMKVHSKPYICNICTQSYNSKINLMQHMILHTENPYSCNICNKAFTCYGNLRKHILVHTGQKPYSCNICNMAFNHPSNLKRHIMLKHTGD